MKGLKKMKPEIVNYPNTEKLKELCRDYINAIANGEKTDETIHFKIFYEALQVFYGSAIIEWIEDTRERNNYVETLIRDLGID
jgi:hypothetical protein